jgi:hypothetical protein
MRRAGLLISGVLLATGAGLSLATPASAAVGSDSHRPRHHYCQSYDSYCGHDRGYYCNDGWGYWNNDRGYWNNDRGYYGNVSVGVAIGVGL